MKQLKVLLLSDGLPGHVNQARGLVQWISSRYKVECTELKVRLRMRALARLLLPSLLHRNMCPSGVAKLFYQWPGSLPEMPDLIISAGGNTSFLNVVLAHEWQIPNFFLGSKRRLRSNDFSAHLTLEATGEPHNLVMSLVPTPTNIEQQQREGQALRNELGIASDQLLYCLVIGGDGAGYRYDERSWRQLAELVSKLSRERNCRWLITTSRRTGIQSECLLREGLNPSCVAQAVWWGESPKKVMSAYLGAADVIFVTADSMSMINECIASGKSTVMLEPEDANPDTRYQNALSKFVTLGYCSSSRLGRDHPQPVKNNYTDAVQQRLLDDLENVLISS